MYGYVIIRNNLKCLEVYIGYVLIGSFIESFLA